MKSRILAVALAAVSLQTGCATLTRGTNEAWSIDTDPSGASVKLSNGFACQQTPCTFNLPRTSEFDVVIEKPGYVTARSRVTHEISDGSGTVMAGNILAGGLIGAGVDIYSGALQSLKPNPLRVKLYPVAPFIPMESDPPTVPAPPSTPPK